MKYYVDVTDPVRHYITLTLTLSHASPKQALRLPIWIPGSYCVRDFARHIVDFRAFEKGVQISWLKLDDHTWQLDNRGGSLEVIYTVYANDPSVRGCYVDEERIFLNPCALCFEVEGQTSAPYIFTLPPSLNRTSRWEVATALTPLKIDPNGFGEYSALTYDELIDCPIEIGVLQQLSFEVKGRNHRVAISGGENCIDTVRLSSDLKACCEAVVGLYEDIPFSSYLFLLHIAEDNYGGLEHMTSTALTIGPDSLPIKGQSPINDAYIHLLSLFTHEYFHAWMVKRIRPTSFVDYDLYEKNYTTQLWAFEGFTAYYDTLMVVRSGRLSVSQYLSLLAKVLTKLKDSPGRQKQSLQEASMDAWINFYHPHENTLNTGISYYLKGQAIAFALDILMRTHDTGSIDMLMQYIWTTYGKTRHGIPDNDWPGLFERIGNKKVSAAWHKWVSTTEEIPWEEILAPFGLDYTLQVSPASEDPWRKIGCTLQKRHPQLILATVREGTPASEAGLVAQDEIIALNGHRVNSDNWYKRVSLYTAGEKGEISFFRKGKLKNCTLILPFPQADTVHLSIQSALSADQSRRLQAWLGREGEHWQK